MRVGIPVVALMLIQNPSVSIEAPLPLEICTRMFDHRVDIEEHQRRMCTRSGKCTGSMTSMTVRRTIQNGSVACSGVASRLSEPMSWRYRAMPSNRRRLSGSTSAVRTVQPVSNPSPTGGGGASSSVKLWGSVPAPVVTGVLLVSGSVLALEPTP